MGYYYNNHCCQCNFCKLFPHSRKRIIQIRLKRRNFGIFWLVIGDSNCICLIFEKFLFFQLVVLERRQPICVLRIKSCSKFHQFEVRRIFCKLFFVNTRQKRSIYCRICKAFNAVVAKNRKQKTRFGLFLFGSTQLRISVIK